MPTSMRRPPFAWLLRRMRMLSCAGRKRSGSSGGFASAEAGGADRHLGARLGEIEPCLDQWRLDRVPAPAQTLVEPVQAPDVLGMLAGAAQLAVVAQVGSVDRFGLLEMALLQQQCAQRMPRRLHPAPRLVVGQRVVELHGAAQMGEAQVEVAAA